MASTNGLRRFAKRWGDPRRFRIPRFVLASALGVGLVCLLLLAQLASRQEQQAAGSPPAFLGNALGSPQPASPLVRAPEPGLTLNVTGASFGLASELASVTLATSGSGTWRRYERGAHRTTSFGSETITFEKESLEQYLTVEGRQGRRTWTWKLDGSARARLLDGGRVGFVDEKTGRVADVLLGPAKIFGTNGRGRHSASHTVAPRRARRDATARPRPRRRRAPGSICDRSDRLSRGQRGRAERRRLALSDADGSEHRPGRRLPARPRRDQVEHEHRHRPEWAVDAGVADGRLRQPEGEPLHVPQARIGSGQRRQLLSVRHQREHRRHCSRSPHGRGSTTPAR